jgi:hypothetical protein
MGQIKISAAAVLNARPEDVYATIADYRHGHPNIIPKDTFSDLQVEQGGYGAGTFIRFKVKTLGVEQPAYQRIREPEPGHIPVEQDIDSPRNTITTFTVTPVEQDEKAHVEIATKMNSNQDFQGFVECFLVPMLLLPVYRKKLKLP